MLLSGQGNAWQCLKCYLVHSSRSSVLSRKIKVWDLQAALDPRAPASTLCLRTLVVCGLWQWAGVFPVLGWPPVYRPVGCVTRKLVSPEKCTVVVILLSQNWSSWYFHHRELFPRDYLYSLGCESRLLHLSVGWCPHRAKGISPWRFGRVLNVGVWPRCTFFITACSGAVRVGCPPGCILWIIASTHRRT